VLGLTDLDYSSSGFCWTLLSGGRDVRQRAYHLQLGFSADFSLLLWDSGETVSEASCYVPYAGPAMPYCEALYWRVRVWDDNGGDSGWSVAQQILTGPDPEDFGAIFITPDMPGDAALSKGKLLRRPFEVGGEVKRAVAYVTALGLYELWINGARVGDALLAPGWTEYRKRLLYQTWDVTPLLRPGENAVGAMLGAGWYKGDLAGWIGLRGVYGERTALLMRLELLYADGRRETVATDARWRCSDGPILFSELYHGEIYDARLEQPGWDSAGFDDSGWSPVEPFPLPFTDCSPQILRPQEGPPIRRQEELPAQRVITTPKGETVLDFGQNLAGWVRFAARGQAGDTVRLRHAETLDREGNFYTENLRSAKCEITYTLRDDAPVIFEPHFTFQGFRYAQVLSYPGQVLAEDFSAVAVHSDMRRAGHFECSHDLLNQLHHNILWSLKGNFVGVPTDCPQRDERLGWTGDAQIFIRTSTYLMDTRAFFIEWLRDLRAAQFENGAVPYVVPDILTGKFIEGDVVSNAEAVSGWGDAAAICPWALWLAYGDKAALAECYGSMKAWVGYIQARATGGLLWDNDYQLGDWVALDAEEGSYYGATDTSLIATAYYALCTDILRRAAVVLDKPADAARYQALRRDIGDAYAGAFFSPDGRLTSPTQTAHILSLAFDLTPPAHRARTIGGLLALLKENGGHLNTGFLGTPYFCQVLADNDCLEEAYDLLLKEDYPSWLYQVKKGATTVWEHWDGIKPDGSMWSPGMNSLNHYAYGAVGEFLYRVVGGIDICEDAPGYKRIKIQPRPGGGLTWADTSVRTPYGKVGAAWRIDGHVFSLTVDIPHNTSAEIILPDGTVQETGSGRHHLSCAIAV